MMKYNSRLHQAVSLALSLVERELKEQPVGQGYKDWRADLTAARKTLQAAHNVLERARPAPDYPPSQRKRKAKTNAPTSWPMSGRLLDSGQSGPEW